MNTETITKKTKSNITTPLDVARAKAKEARELLTTARASSEAAHGVLEAERAAFYDAPSLETGKLDRAKANVASAKDFLDAAEKKSAAASEHLEVLEREAFDAMAAARFPVVAANGLVAARGELIAKGRRALVELRLFAEAYDELQALCVEQARGYAALAAEHGQPCAQPPRLEPFELIAREAINFSTDVARTRRRLGLDFADLDHTAQLLDVIAAAKRLASEGT